MRARVAHTRPHLHKSSSARFDYNIALVADIKAVLPVNTKPFGLPSCVDSAAARAPLSIESAKSGQISACIGLLTAEQACRRRCLLKWRQNGAGTCLSSIGNHICQRARQEEKHIISDSRECGLRHHQVNQDQGR